MFETPLVNVSNFLSRATTIRDGIFITGRFKPQLDFGPKVIAACHATVSKAVSTQKSRAEARLSCNLAAPPR